MSEKLTLGQEFEVKHSGETAHHHAERLREQAEHEKRHGTAEHVSEVQKKVEQHAATVEKPSVEKSEHHAQAHHAAGKDLKNLTFNRTLVRVRKQLSAPQKVLSNIIHQPVIDTLSEVGAKTVARPSGVFGGGLFALLGTASLLYLTRKHGYEFNYLVFAMMFVVGFLIGSLIEIAVKVLRRRQQRS